MARLSAAERARLPDRAFAYVDSQGRRRLPLVDAAHVRNALARFDQVQFEDEAAREQARTRLLRAAQRFRIVPVGFISSQLRTQRTPGARPPLPRGFVTLMMSDVEGSTSLLDALGDDYATLLQELRDVQVGATEATGGVVVEVRADEVFAAFESPLAALESTIQVQRELRGRRGPAGEVRVRVGLHAGYPTLHEPNYVGMAVHTTARICSAGHGGQIVVSGDTATALTGMVPAGVRLRSLGSFRLRGIPGDVSLLQVVAPGLLSRFPPLRAERTAARTTPRGG